jgi:hypothetical protein
VWISREGLLAASGNGRNGCSGTSVAGALRHLTRYKEFSGEEDAAISLIGVFYTIFSMNGTVRERMAIITFLSVTP